MKDRYPCRNGKLALVLAGGGLMGAVYEIGALRAIDDLLVDRTVNDFDMYVGTSAGAIVAALLANGIGPEQMFQGIAGVDPQVRPIERGHLFDLNQRELLQRSLNLPKGLAQETLYHLRHLNELTLLDWLWSVTQVLPSGLYDGMALERYMRTVLTTSGGSNDFDDVKRDLLIVATELDTGERAVFGAGGLSGVPISLAVAASSAMPMVYKPVRVGQTEYIDGGLRGSASIDLAIERGANLVVCINPMVPYCAARAARGNRREKDYLSAGGVPAIASQASRITVHAGLHYHIKQLQRTYPAVDIILIEPRADDARMFSGNVMHYPDRLEVARHGFETVTLDLAEDYNKYKSVLACHGIPLTRRMVVEELEEVRRSGQDPKVIHRMLEARSASCNRRRRHTPTCQLTRALAVLELELDLMSAERAAHADTISAGK